VIQLGAILAVVVHYRRLLGERVIGLVKREPDSLRLLYALVAAFIPTAIAGVLLRKTIKRLLFGPTPVAIALVVGGVAMIVAERLLAKRTGERQTLEEVTPLDGFIIGVAQCISLWPGTSRAMTTLVAGRVRGLTPRVSAEFSFLLALPVLGAATALDLYKDGRALLATADARLALAVGFLVSFLVAWAAIGWFLSFLAKRSLEAFGWYRILAGIAVFVLIARS
jgi:undecaprenyl-diphosphatase